jgi:hypothetical protein
MLQVSKALRRCAVLIASGYPEATAAQLSADEFRIDGWTMVTAWRASRGRYRARITFSRRLVAEMLCAKGWTNRQTAAVLGVHKNHVVRMRKALKEDARQRVGLRR